MTDLKIGFIGGGSMASSIIGGLIADGVKPQNICVTDINESSLNSLSAHFGVNTSNEGAEVVRFSQVLVLAVKPQQLADVVQGLAPQIQEKKPLLMSVAAGIRTDVLELWAGGDVPVVRAMPNTPALVRSGATALFANAQVDEAARSYAENVIRAVGLCIWLENEDQMDAVTALSGSGPAYFFFLMEYMQAAAQELGLPADTARMLTLETALGAAKLAIELGKDVAELRQMVTSPGGTTERAISTMQGAGVDKAIVEALKNAAQRSQELAQEFGTQKT
ncbi:MAG: pyrroline-5-carboxylate reductase [Gammaproteobacteria bacterium]|nr:pyrroline-5-carboxylate reductase [Gammaproteobacteria bacterium]MDH5691980.1 pyrroline-5-carboxylate reductase [Gammaproteobacteria bacterium]